jgi:glycosyltransferase involved in cell wall biosynthesis
MQIAYWTLCTAIAMGCTAWLVQAALAVRAMRAIPVLVDTDCPPPAQRPRVTLIVPACNEAESIEAAARSLLAQDYPNLEFILVNDRSTDRTGEIIERLASADPRIRALHVTHLPAGWLGKVHALHSASKIATGDWLLFIDADVHLAPSALQKAIAFCVGRGREHLAILPTFWSSTFWLDAVMASFLRMGVIGSRSWAIEDPRSTAAIGVGAFNLVRRDAFARTPGFEFLRLEVVDDIGLGQMLKRCGVRSSFAVGRDLVGLHWYRSVNEMVRGTEKNAFAAIGRYSPLRTIGFVAAYLVMELAPLVALLPLWPIWLNALGAASLVAALSAIAMLARRLRQRLLPALLFPAGAAIFAYAVLRSGVLAILRGGLLWRGTLYRTTDLRAGQRYRFL